MLNRGSRTWPPCLFLWTVVVVTTVVAESPTTRKGSDLSMGPHVNPQDIAVVRVSSTTARRPHFDLWSHATTEAMMGPHFDPTGLAGGRSITNP